MVPIWIFFFAIDIGAIAIALILVSLFAKTKGRAASLGAITSLLVTAGVLVWDYAMHEDSPFFPWRGSTQQKLSALADPASWLVAQWILNTCMTAVLAAGLATVVWKQEVAD